MDQLEKMQGEWGYNLEEIVKADSLRKFHSEYSCNVFEEKDTYELFGKFKVQETDLEDIQVPTLILHAKDDPICDYRMVMKDEIRKNPKLFYAETKIGSHICWFDGNIGAITPVVFFLVLVKIFSGMTNRF